MEDNRHSQRQPTVVKRDCNLGIFTFKHLEWTDYHAAIVDISNGGVGIELSDPVEPGIVLFRDRILGQQSGVLLWSKQVGSQYRSGIRFVSLSPDVERFINNNTTQPGQHEPLTDLQKIVAMQLESIKEDHD
jgi:hypothetical protein